MAEGFGIRLSDTALIENSQGLVSISKQKKIYNKNLMSESNKKKRSHKRES